MIKKVLATVVAAGALSVPLAGVAWADTTTDNPGVPGNIGGNPPGGTFSQVAQFPGSVPDVVKDLTQGQFSTPGGALQPFVPRH
jgi:hypothetical protein